MARRKCKRCTKNNTIQDSPLCWECRDIILDRLNPNTPDAREAEAQRWARDYLRVKGLL